MKQKIIIINSHPIQYFAPLYAHMVSNRNIDLTVFYCSDHGLKRSLDTQFGVEFSWDIPLLKGYHYRFFKNYMPRGFRKGVWNLFNPGVIKALFAMPPGIVILHGWSNLTNIFALFFGKLKGHTICLKGESSYTQELQKPKFKTFLKKWTLNLLIFPLIDYFLYIGLENKLFYENYGIKDQKLIPAPYCVDNERFSKAYQRLKGSKIALREKLGLPKDKKLILFVGKYIEKKRPMDLLNAFLHMPLRKEAGLVFVGEGNLRNQMEAFIKAHNLEKEVFLTGFVNQSVIEEYYSACDIFTMCSGLGETWGLATNEAMNFHLPVVISLTSGCSKDLVRNGENGFTFETGNYHALASRLNTLLSLSEENICLMGEKSAEIVSRYSYEKNIANLKQLNSKNGEETPA